MTEELLHDLELELEEHIGMMYSVFYRMRQKNLYQIEYDAMGTLIHMLSKDRQFIRENYVIDA